MRRFLAGVVCLLWLCGLSVWGAEYKLTNGDIIRGEATSFNDDGFIVRLATGGFSPRVGWGKVSQETLKELIKNPQAQKFAEPFIEVPQEVKEQERRERKKEIVVKEPDRPALATGKEGFFSGFMNPLGLFVLGIIYLANLYAAFEVALFRGRPVALVVLVSAILPILGPLLFALIPGAPSGGYPPAAEAAPAEAAPAAAEQRPAGPAGMGLAAHGAPAAAGGANPLLNQVFNRSSTSFDRRFFETKFTGFFRVVPADSDKDLVLVIKAAKAEYIAKRISRISMTEMHMQLLRGATEVSVPFSEIVEVAVRHKDQVK